MFPVSTYTPLCGSETYFATLLCVHIRQRENTFECLHCEGIVLLHRYTQVSYSEHTRSVGSMKTKLDLSFHLLLVRHFWVMDECASARIRRLVARGCVFEAFNNGCLPAAIVTHDDCNWREELNDRDLFVVERTNSANSKLVQMRHFRQEEAPAELVLLSGIVCGA